jgi:adenylate cyclase
MEIDRIKVKGKNEPESVFMVLGRTELEGDPNCRELREVNKQFLDLYREQQWDAALAVIDRCRSAAKNFDAAGLYEMYEERIEKFKVTPPSQDWQGAYEAESK